jgi:ubiquinone/menaquinone biosynthesis C-methylase UbiE
MEARGAVTRHYASGDDLEQRIVEQLRGAGLLEGQRLMPRDLAALDQFHVGGLEASEALARLCSLSSDMHVLDVGSGLGGPSRFLAATYGCRVTGIDVTESYCRIASLLAEHMGLEHLVDYRHGDALHLPFADQTFDAVWTQHASMNIAEKAELYAEIARIVKAGGRFAVHDVVQSTGGAILFPVPWARSADVSHLITPGETREVIVRSGFSVLVWNDVSEAAADWLSRVGAKREPADVPRLGLHLVLGQEFAEMAANFRRNLMEHRCGVIQAVFERTS